MLRRPIPWFFVLAFTGTWTLQSIVIALDLPLVSPTALILLTFAGVMPSLVAVLLRRRCGREATHSLWGPPGRAGSSQVALGLLTPIGLVLVTVALLSLLGTPVPEIRPPSAFILGSMVVASVGEELGWRGFAYPRLQGTLGAVRASMVVGVLWGLWHLPTAFFEPDPSMADFSFFVIQTTAASVVIAWLMERAGRRTILAIAFHAGGYLTLFQIPRTPEAASIRTLVYVGAAVLAALALRRSSARSGSAEAGTRDTGPERL